MKFDYNNVFTHLEFGTVRKVTGLLGTSGEVSVMKNNGLSLRVKPGDLIPLYKSMKQRDFIYDVLKIHASSMSNADVEVLAIYVLMNSKGFNVMDVAEQLSLKEDVEAEILKDSFN